MEPTPEAPALPSLDPARVYSAALALFKERFLLFVVLSGLFVGAALTGLLPLAAAVPLALLGRASPWAWLAWGLIGLSWILWCVTWWQAAVLEALLSPEPASSPWACARRSFGRATAFSWACLLWFLFAAGGLWVFVLPGLYLALALSLAPLIALSEGAGGFSAILRSLDRAEGRFWSLAGNLVPALVIYLAASFLPIPWGFLAAGAAGFFASAVLVVFYKNLGPGPAREGGARRWSGSRTVLALSGLGLLIPSFLIYRSAVSVGTVLPGLIAKWQSASSLPGMPDLKKLLPPLPGLPAQ